MNKMVFSIHEAEGQDITFQDDVAYSLVTGGGQTGTGISVRIGYLLYQDTVGALQAVDYKGPNRQYVDSDKLIIEIWD